MSESKIVDIPDYGDVYEMEVFVQACQDGTFIDYDGNGHPVVDGKMDRSIDIYPSEVVAGKFQEYKKIVWFNR
jgi:hypothetical protein